MLASELNLQLGCGAKWKRVEPTWLCRNWQFISIGMPLHRVQKRRVEPDIFVARVTDEETIAWW